MKHFLISFIFISNAMALDLFYNNDLIPEKYQLLNAPDKYAYSFVMKHCNNWSLAFSEITKSGLSELASIVGGVEVEGLEVRKMNGGRGLHLETIITAQGYLYGLNDCFKDDKDAKDYFTMNLLAADTLGTASGASIGALTWIGGSRAVTWFVRKLRIPPTTLRKIKKGFYIAVGVSAGGYVIVNVFNRINAKMKYIEKLNDSNKEKEKLLIKVRSDLDELDVFARDPEITDNDRTVIKEYREKLLKRIKKIETNISKYRKEIKKLS